MSGLENKDVILNTDHHDGEFNKNGKKILSYERGLNF
jgi:hypothetical protein